MGRFDERLIHPLPGWRDKLRLLRGHAASHPFRPLGADAISTESAPEPLRQDGVQWLGHASALAVVDGLRVVFDPIFRDRIGPVRRAHSAPLPPERLRPDVVCISHDHRDHLDARAARALKGAQWLVPLGTASWCRRQGIQDVQEFDWGDHMQLQGVRLRFVEAHHWCRRGLGDTNARLWGGWTVQGTWSLYHAGDTGAGPALDAVARAVPGLDVALLPIGGCEPRWFMRHKHTNPEDVAATAAAWEAAGTRPTVVPIHWGTYRISVERLDTVVPRLRAAWEDQRLPWERLHVLPIGGTWYPDGAAEPAQSPKS